ncbi:tetratricopeptide repeat protein [candidate division KSB1 bacterium]|nr:tetratricopeptide repeat protein [candidate division KSB1 bacterium]
MWHKPLLIIGVLSFLFGLSCRQKDTPEARLQQATRLEQEILEVVPQISRCQEIYQQILLDFPQSEAAIQATYKIGKLHEIFGHYEQAITAYRNLLTLYPQHPLSAEALFNAAQIYQQHLSKPDAATDTYTQLVTFYPNFHGAATAYWRLGQQAAQKKDWAAAAHYFQTLISHFPKEKLRPAVCFRLGDIYQQQLSDSLQARQMFEIVAREYAHSTWAQAAQTRLVTLKTGGTNHAK